LETDVGAVPTPQEILEALGRTGFLLEQEVATELQQLGLHVNTGVAFQDPDEGKSREIDVLATGFHVNRENMIGVKYEIICECKNTQWPFVLIGPAKTDKEFLYEPVGCTFPVPHFAEPVAQEASEPESYVLVPTFSVLRLDDEHYIGNSHSAVQIARISRKSNKWQADNEGIFDSIIYPIAKALLARKKTYTLDEPPEPGQLALVYLCFPIIVTSGGLYFLDTTEADPAPKEVSHVTLLREIRTRNTNGHFMIDFVTKDGLSSFVQKRVHSFVQAVVRRVISAPPHYFHSRRHPPESN
jgi:hypothetical protein